MHFGTQGGAKLAGVWKENLKHGAGILICGNGRQIQNDPLFLNDKPIHIDRSSLKTVSPTHLQSQGRKSDASKDKASLQVLAKQISSKQPQKRFENVNLKLKKETNEKCNPLDIPLYSAPEQVSFDYCILTVLVTLKNDDGSNFSALGFEDKASGVSYKLTHCKKKTNKTSLFCRVNKTIDTSRWNVPPLASFVSRVEKTPHENQPEWINSKISFPDAARDSPKIHYVDLLRYQNEEKNLRHCITTNLQQLKQIYDKYATICSMHSLDFKPAMVRMFLWQLWRDLGIVDETTSICDLDLILNENPASGYETVHCPFEKIYFWQFLQVHKKKRYVTIKFLIKALVSMSWFLLLKFQEPICNTGGTLANCFRKFLNQHFLVPRLHVRGLLFPQAETINYKIFLTAYSLFEFRDLLPIDAVYRLYRKLGEPHTARDFIKATCVRKSKQPPCYLKTIDQKQTAKISTNRGFNSVPVGLSVTFLPEGTHNFANIHKNVHRNFTETEEYRAIETIEYEDPLFYSLITFRSLGIRTVVQCLSEVCPQIVQDGILVKIDYPLSFFEFYEVLLLCAYKMVDKKQREKEALELLSKMEEETEQAESEQVTPAISDRKVRKGSREMKKKFKVK